MATEYNPYSEIQGVECHKLNVFPDERGVVRRIVGEAEFGYKIKDVYFTSVYKDVVKGWHGYKTKTICFTCIRGAVKFVLRDGRVESPTYDQIVSYIIGTDNYCRIVVPPGVFSAFKGIADFSEIINVTTEEFSESGMIRLPHDAIEYDWRTKNG